MKKILIGVLGIMMFLGMTGPVFAANPTLELVAQGRSVESAGGWGTTVYARPGDTFLLWFVVKNTGYGTVASNAKVKVDMPSGESNPLILTVHAVADNATEVTQNVTINLNGPASTITYVPSNDAEVITNGAHTKISPDQDGANMTTQYVGIGSINGGDFSYAKVLGTTKLAPRNTPALTETPTPTGVVSGATTTATASAVAKTTPATGDNEVIWPTVAFLALGMGGFALRSWAKKATVLVN